MAKWWGQKNVVSLSFALKKEEKFVQGTGINGDLWTGIQGQAQRDWFVICLLFSMIELLSATSHTWPVVVEIGYMDELLT